MQNLLLQTDKTILRDHILVQYPSISTIADKPGEIFIDANLNQCKLAVKDVLIFAPMLAANLKGNEQAIFALNGSAKGFVKDISIPNFELSGVGSTAVQLFGNIKGLPDAKNTYYNLQLQKFVTTKKDIENLAPINSIPANIRIPERLSAKGSFKGTMRNFAAKLNTQTTNGSADITGSMSNGGKSYTAKILLSKLDLGYILKQETNLGKITLQANATGSGFDYKTMTAKVNAKLLEGEIKKYNYKNLYLDASVAKGNAVVESSIRDPYISYLLKATADLKNKYPAVQMNLQLDTLNLLALHLIADSLQMSGILNADFTNTNPDALAGNLKIYNLALNSNNKKITTDTITLVATNSNDSGEQINLHAEMADINWNGNYKLTEVAQALQHTINRYYNIPGFKDTAFTPQQWQMDMHLRTSPLVLQFMPELKGTDTIGAKITFNSEQNNLDLSIAAPKIQYGEQAIEQLNVTATTEDRQLNYNLSVNKAGNKGFQLYKTSLAGNIANNTLYASLLIRDKKETNRYQFAATVNQENNGIKFALKPDSLLLDYDKWQVSNDNFIRYDSTGIMANNFLISNKDQSLRINSTSASMQAPLEVAFKNFGIHTLTSFAEQDSLLMDGVIDGNVIVKNATTNPVFTSDLLIKDFSYKKDTVGNISVKVDNETANAFNANVKIEGNGNNIQLDGKYYTGESKMDLKLNIANFNLATAKPFAAGQLKDAGGNLKGNITIAGTVDKPAVNGDVHFENAFIVSTVLGERFTLPDEKITVSSQGINFNDFTLVDSSGNKAIINGDVLTSDFKNYKFAVDINADDFSLINSTKADNTLFYGKLNVDAKVKVNGDMQAPAVDANININKSTDFTLVLPSDDPEVQEREGVVNFVDRDAPQDTLHKIDFRDTLINTAALAGMNLSAIIETDTAALFTLVIDERSGDALSLKGKADLAAGIDESGKLSLTGNYEIEKGSYQLSFNFLKRKFDIQKGSIITWTGDPTSAIVDITALYEAKAPPIDLVEAQLGGLSTTEQNKYKQRIQVNVLLKMKGELLKPQITFDITLPNDELQKWEMVDSKLQQLRTDESELNKQVFALLLLNRFVGEDITQSAAGSTSTATLVRQSVSSILADQLNKIAGSLIKGVDVNFGINAEDDYTTGTQQIRTDLTVGLSKSLFNDRVKVSVGSNFALEGATNPNQAASTIAGDVAVDYQVSKDGRYMLRAYRKNNYEGVIEGQVIETGLTFIFTLDYDHFKELFQKKDKALKEARKKEKQERKQEQQQSSN
ncbi:MAG: translocation/assembly module TamB domain-containing protein [Panacibacter sp.]